MPILTMKKSQIKLKFMILFIHQRPEFTKQISGPKSGNLCLQKLRRHEYLLPWTRHNPQSDAGEN